MMQFACPLAFAALLLPLIVWYAVPAAKGLHGDALRVPFLRDLAKINLKSGSIWGGLSADNAKLFSPVRLAVYLIYALVITALARAQWVGEPVRVHNFSRDILLVMDISTSMEEPDFALNGARSAVCRPSKKWRANLSINAAKIVSGWCCSVPELICRRR